MVEMVETDGEDDEDNGEADDNDVDGEPSEAA